MVPQFQIVRLNLKERLLHLGCEMLDDSCHVVIVVFDKGARDLAYLQQDHIAALVAENVALDLYEDALSSRVRGLVKAHLRRGEK